uniref:Pleckstrin homology and RhoGEF domain containing G1 n=1 Tax=Anabas testudineus TaxID=64144 RepID=A0A3Q1IHN1_ANATE
MPTDDYNYLPDVLPPLPEVPDSGSVLSSIDIPTRCLRNPAFRHASSRYCSALSMDSSPDSAERPISYSSTSSSASSRDSHCSLGSRSTLVSATHCNPATSDRDSGAIRLELVPARQLGCGEDDVRTDGGMDIRRGQGRQGSGQTPTEHSEPEQSPEGGEQTVQGPRTYVDRVVQEILDTERTYVQDLRSIVEDYLECISNQCRLALSSEDKGSLFGNIQDIYHFNRDLLHDLEKCNADPVAIAECFVSKSEEFHIYTQYCTNYPRSVAVLTECMRNKALAKFFRERQESLRHSLPLGSYLLKPVQRILKYHLLLHEIANHMEKDTETYEVVHEAIDTMQRVAWHINDMKRKHEHAVRLQEIQSQLTNWKGPDLIGYGELVLEGTFRLQRAKNERTLFLFDKLLLITKKREETYTYKAHILCCNLMLVEVIPKEPLSFSVFHYKNPKLQHTVQAKSQQDKRMWILHLKRLILENHPAKIPAKVRATYHPGFHYSPDGDKKDSTQTKEGPTPRRGRRRGEASRESLVRDSSHHPPLLRTPHVTEEPPESPIPSVIVTESDHSVRNIWADHRARRAMFPTRQRTMQPDDEDEDIYQMFVPTEPSGPEQEVPSERSEATSSPRMARPCSWHVEQVPTVQIDPPTNGSRVLRRSSSAGEKARDARQSPGEDQTGDNLEVIHTESSSNDISGSSSAEQLTIDDIENVYDNISYEDLKSMGLIRRDLEERRSGKGTSTNAQGSQNQTARVPNEVSESMIEPDSSSESNRSSTQEGRQFGTCELQIQEENIYDTITFREPPSIELKGTNEGKNLTQERDSLLASQQDLTESLGGFVSEESLHFAEDEGADTSRCVPCSSEPDYSSSSASETFSRRVQKGDKMSEQVDEIWNDLENYIKTNEKKGDRLPAAFPVSATESPKRSSSVKSSPTKGPPVNSPQATSPPTKSPPLPQRSTQLRENPLKDLHSLFPGELAGLDSPLASSSLLLGESVDFPLELMDKTKSRVFLMARQYSQKIKKANQLLRMRSMDPGDSCSRARAEKKQKDLAAILEEKKQGGAAIGARIAEYSQLYDQVMFKDPPSPAGQTSATPHHSHPGLPYSPSMPETSLEEDWLHSTYSNGELASFVSSASEVGNARASSTPHRRLTSACSIPSLKTLPPSPSSPPSQRWSSCMSAPSEKEEHVYSSIKRHPSFNAPSLPSSKPSPSGHSESVSSLGSQQQEKNNQSGHKSNGPNMERSSDRLHGPSLGRAGRQSSLPEQSTLRQSGLTLHDGQQVVVLNRASALSILTATQNYLANFKDNGEDDDDYVEIRSEDESEQELDRLTQKNSHSAALSNQSRGLVHSQSLPCTPLHSRDPLRCLDREHLEKYLWSEPQQSQSNIVQSLRERFQCLGSSSFA